MPLRSAALVLAFSASAFAQGHPDLEGVWSFATLTPLERPAALAGKTHLTDQEAAEYAKQTRERRNFDRRDGGGQQDVARAYNDLFYDFGNRASNQTSLILDPPDGRLPAMTPHGERRAAGRSARLAGIPSGPQDRSLWERCILGFNSGPPMMPSGYNNNVQIYLTAGYAVIFNEMVHNTRVVPLDGRPHGTVRQWLGDSRGHWEGQTLVIDTVNFTANGTGTIGLRVATDENLHLVERFTRRSADSLIYEFTVDDPTIWTKPWTASVPMAKTDEPIYEYACHEGNYGMQGILAGARAEEKAAEAQPKGEGDSTIEFENEWVRIARVHYAAHETTRYHDHPATPTVYVYTTDGGRLRILHDEKEEPVIRPVVKAGSIRFNRGALEHHQVEEMDGVPSEYLRLELKIAPVDMPETDVRRAPGDRTPYESGMLRILRVTCAANSVCPASAHPEDPAVEVIGARYRWAAPNDPAYSNTTNQSIDIVRVELKSRPLR